MDELSYFEKLENLYVLNETREMLLKKLQVTENNSVLRHVITDDLNKIEEEMSLYSNGLSGDEVEKSIPPSLINPAVYFDEEDPFSFS